MPIAARLIFAPRRAATVRFSALQKTRKSSSPARREIAWECVRGFPCLSKSEAACLCASPSRRRPKGALLARHLARAWCQARAGHKLPSPYPMTRGSRPERDPPRSPTDLCCALCTVKRACFLLAWQQLPIGTCVECAMRNANGNAYWHSALARCQCAVPMRAKPILSRVAHWHYRVAHWHCALPMRNAKKCQCAMPLV